MLHSVFRPIHQFLKTSAVGFLGNHSRQFKSFQTRHFFHALSFFFWEILAMGITAGIAFLSCLGLLYFVKAVWIVFSSTHVGEQFRLLQGEKTLAMEALCGRNLFDLAFQLIRLTMEASLAVAAIAQATLLRAAYYYPAGLPGKFFLWMIPVAAMVSFWAERLYGVQWSKLFWICIPASCLILSHFMNVVPRVIPDGLFLNIPFKALQQLKYLGGRLLDRPLPPPKQPMGDSSQTDRKHSLHFPRK